MSNCYLFQDRIKCIGCHSYELQCESSKFLPSGSILCQIVPDGPQVIDGLPRLSHILMSCFHCETPWCVAACPTGTMKKRPRDEIVYVDPLLCIGCKNFISACPWGSVQWDPEKHQAIKCDLCMDRIDQGLKPACVTVCLSHCLEFGMIEEKSRDSGKNSVLP